MLHVICMSLIKIVGRNFVLADLFNLSPMKNNKKNKNNKVRCKLIGNVALLGLPKYNGSGVDLHLACRSLLGLVRDRFLSSMGPS